ncbi:MAG: tetratricopeptide repeat protein [Pseudomonadales bacterium]|jgi:tetratricopeptide (TPR) repeat protein|nr:tetratricopeptide repeat protein [Pseudomonadales bacterium]MDP6472133.1 tetratricopeptide repeat protein [Pseudomonadales bacterium]MDP6826615.1 tetratricopeptide repeat protein [Pseudomonadales bacterium]MDP6970114.1 tetratricopeptide repeat protein [Pseudomonadales bacterium]|tara:strand:- start:228 stop:1826 length:1599 start_codon:yes stop_codon:yes gene_type:complete
MRPPVQCLFYIALTLSTAAVEAAIPRDAHLEPQVAEHIARALSAVEQTPESGSAWGELGMVYQANGLIGDARTSYTQARRRAPNDYRWHLLSALVEAKPHHVTQRLGEAHARAPDDYALVILYADNLVRTGRLLDSRAFYEHARKLDPGRGYADLGLARLDLLDRSLDQAEAHLQRALLNSPRNGDIHTLLAQVRQRQGNNHAAEQSAWRARSYGPGPRPRHPLLERMRKEGVSSALLQERGRELLAHGDFDTARQLLIRSHDIRPGAETQSDLARVDLAQGRFQQALTRYREVLERKPNNADWLTGAALALVQLGNLEAAEGQLRAALGQQPDHADANEAMGKVCLAGHRHREAAEYLQKTIGLDPTRYRLYHQLGVALENAGDPRNSLAARQKLRTLDPVHAANLRAVARLHLHLGDVRAAATTMRNLMSIHPDDVDVGLQLVQLLATTAEISSPDARDALEIATHLYARRRHDARFADLLAAAFAANARFEDAIRLGKRALTLAGDDPELTRTLSAHLDHYVHREPLRR